MGLTWLSLWACPGERPKWSNAAWSHQFITEETQSCDEWWPPRYELVVLKVIATCWFRDSEIWNVLIYDLLSPYIKTCSSPVELGCVAVPVPRCRGVVEAMAPWALIAMLPPRSLLKLGSHRRRSQKGWWSACSLLRLPVVLTKSWLGLGWLGYNLENVKVPPSAVRCREFEKWVTMSDLLFSFLFTDLLLTVTVQKHTKTYQNTMLIYAQLTALFSNTMDTAFMWNKINFAFSTYERRDTVVSAWRALTKEMKCAENTAYWICINHH